MMPADAVRSQQQSLHQSKPPAEDTGSASPTSNTSSRRELRQLRRTNHEDEGDEQEDLTATDDKPCLDLQLLPPLSMMTCVQKQALLRHLQRQERALKHQRKMLLRQSLKNIVNIAAVNGNRSNFLANAWKSGALKSTATRSP